MLHKVYHKELRSHLNHVLGSSWKRYVHLSQIQYAALMGLIQNVNESSSGLKTLIIYSFLLFTILHIYAGKTWNRYKRGKGKI